MADSLNDKIQDRVIAHSVYLEAYKNAQVKKIIDLMQKNVGPDFLSKLEKRLEKITQRGTDLGKNTTERMKVLENFFAKFSDEFAEELKASVVAELKELANDELFWQMEVINGQLSVELDFVMPPPQTVASAALGVPFSGLTLEQWFETLKTSTQRNLTQAIQRGIVEGETVQQMVQRVRGTRARRYQDGVLGVTTRQAEAIVRTAVTHVSNHARLELFKENSDIISGLKWVSVLDSRTTLQCASLDGKVFPIDEGPRPPLHVNCRSTMTAVLVDAEALGLDNITERTRASIDGAVPAKTTYGDWLKRQPHEVQNMVLGKSRARLYRSGNLPIERFVGSDLKPLTLKELRAKEKSAFTKAGL